MARITHDNYALVFGVAYLGLMTNALLVLSCLPAFAAQAAVVLSPAECEVWARELGFAASVAAHDAAAFAEHVDPGAVFGAGRERQARGREAVVVLTSHISHAKLYLEIQD